MKKNVKESSLPYSDFTCSCECYPLRIFLKHLGHHNPKNIQNLEYFLIQNIFLKKYSSAYRFFPKVCLFPFFYIAKTLTNDQFIFLMNCFIFSFVVKHELCLSFPFPHFQFPLKEDHPVLKVPSNTQLLRRPMSLCRFSLLPLSYMRELLKILTILELLKTVEEFSKHFYGFYVLDGLYSHASLTCRNEIFSKVLSQP